MTAARCIPVAAIEAVAATRTRRMRPVCPGVSQRHGATSTDGRGPGPAWASGTPRVQRRQKWAGKASHPEG